LTASKKWLDRKAHSLTQNVREVSPGLTWNFTEQVLQYYHSQGRGARGNMFFPAVISPGFCTSHLRKKNFEKPFACKKRTSKKYIFSEDKGFNHRTVTLSSRFDRYRFLILSVKNVPVD
jgi:hypothetical protein